MDAITRYWGKARPAEAAEAGWHPLAYHSLDVAAAMDALLRVRPRWLEILAQTTGLAVAETRTRLVLVAALHDLGKFAENFQWKVPDLAAQFGHVPKLDLSGHGSVGQTLWNHIGAGVGLGAVDQWMIAALSHHGTPVELCGNLCDAMSSAARDDALAFLRGSVVLVGAPSSGLPAKKKYEVWRVAGLVILADWIGSNRDWFPYTRPTLSLAEYWAKAQTRAADALRHADLAEAPCADGFDLVGLLGEIRAGVYVGVYSRKTRERIWTEVGRMIGAGSAVIAWSAPTDSGFTFEAIGTNRREPMDFDGLTLVRYTPADHPSDDPPFAP